MNILNSMKKSENRSIVKIKFRYSHSDILQEENVSIFSHYLKFRLKN